MFMRRRPLLRAAAVGGGAYIAGKRTAQRRADEEQQAAYQDARISDLEQQQAPQQAPPQPPPAPAQAPSASSPMIDQLNQLAALHQQGVLTDDEFAAAKAKLFGT
jgi:hypothetical protein